jgi:hypothetical protein
MYGSKHGSWNKGVGMTHKEPTTYSGIHTYLLREYGNAPECIWDKSHTSRLEWANVSGAYTTDLEDYLPMCASCHRKFDVTENQRNITAERARGNNWATAGMVYQLTAEGKLINSYISSQAAARQSGVLRTAIANTLAGRTKTAGGYIWTRKLF